MTSIPVIPGIKVVPKGALNRPLKNIICAILFGGLNNLLKGNLLCIEANLEQLMGVNMTAGLKGALSDLKKDIAAYQEHLGVPQTLKRVNEAIADIQKVLALGGMCPVPLKAPKIPNVINDVASSFFGAANGIVNQLGRLAKPQLCIDAKGGINTGAYNPDSILGQMNREIQRIGNIPGNVADKFERSIRGVSRAINAQINRELFPDFRHNHNLLTGGPVVAGAPAITVNDVKQAYDQAQSLVAGVNSTASFPVQCVDCGRGAEAQAYVSNEGRIENIELVGMSRQDITQDSTTGEGTGMLFDVSGRLGQTYEVKIKDGGSGYKVGDVITVSSSTLRSTA